MTFNPDEYLTTKSTSPSKSSSFDPDTYLGKNNKSETSIDRTSTVEALLRGFAKGSNFGFQDEIEGAVGGLTRGVKYLAGNTVGDKGVLDAIRNGYISDRDASRAYDKQLESEHPIASFAGSVASAVPTLAAKGAVTIPSMIAQGAVSGLGNSEGDITNQIKDAQTGALVGGAFGVAGNAVGSVAGKIGDTINNLKTTETLKALGAQKAQRKAIDPRFKESTAQYAIDNGLINPLSSTSEKIAKNSALTSDIGQELDNVKSKLPSFQTSDVYDVVKQSVPSFNPNLEINTPLTNQLKMIENDLASLSKDGTINAKDYLDYKSSLYNMARKSGGEINPAKDLIEQVRRGLGKLEEKIANSAEHSQNLKDYAKVKTIENLLDNKAAQEGNSILGMGGLIAGSAGVGASASTGDPRYLALAALGSPRGRQMVSETAVLGINAIQKSKILRALKAGTIDPKIAAYLLQRGGQN